MSMTRAEVKITVAKLIEASYSKDKGLTTKIMAEKGSFKLTVDQSGTATLSGNAGVLTFSGTPTLEKIGIKVKRISISFENKGEMNIGYSATVNLAVISLTVNGDFDLEELITSCSGLLCSAARALKGRNRAYEAELESIMGR
ncbi:MULTISPECIES: hypothetical protein [Shewanella]|jgi:hypothetical protein|uniref:Uncharacterized protein n=1 Tax=Shewanella psychromarinicola TaxID=2487742 RepID=A0A3N4ELC3_9GAMM|nr:MULTISPECIES: hypothetical protein [Shewanella]AZG36533.1 hypothetical protein EGC80_17830 [Shewanella psychromarinicola]MCL1083108.1 hypothetical protein [Shewanella psychromarinicola]RPA34381.1 hypothetical protein EGC77_01465 [Shewanella psychromarinicola]RPA59242.1 hypothetical protein EGC86_16900 [Shewanella frigidimarina]|tara:strand:+ start:7828 stop:8256 length:429 start_codon:yes stop_codon:yes gene_type:complete